MVKKKNELKSSTSTTRKPKRPPTLALPMPPPIKNPSDQPLVFHCLWNMAAHNEPEERCDHTFNNADELFIHLSESAMFDPMSITAPTSVAIASLTTNGLKTSRSTVPGLGMNAKDGSGPTLVRLGPSLTGGRLKTYQRFPGSGGKASSMRFRMHKLEVDDSILTKKAGSPQISSSASVSPKFESFTISTVSGAEPLEGSFDKPKLVTSHESPSHNQSSQEEKTAVLSSQSESRYHSHDQHSQPVYPSPAVTQSPNHNQPQIGQCVQLPPVVNPPITNNNDDNPYLRAYYARTRPPSQHQHQPPSPQHWHEARQNHQSHYQYLSTDVTPIPLHTAPPQHWHHPYYPHPPPAPRHYPPSPSRQYEQHYSHAEQYQQHLQQNPTQFPQPHHNTNRPRQHYTSYPPLAPPHRYQQHIQHHQPILDRQTGQPEPLHYQQAREQWIPAHY
ncbi:UNVERIFIED_CONTAM: hypothetical protein HDU68_009415 [Siphonaria sp. JEL0065]|nr:hypothetical protein HDU68_009415 [Siphonaria sp. JEL0065]